MRQKHNPSEGEKRDLKAEADQHWKDLASKAQKGDAAAYRALLSELVPVIRRNIAKSLPNTHAIDDVVQEVLISVHKALQTYDAKRPFGPWLYSIIQFRKTDFLRQHYAQNEGGRVSLDDPDTPDYLISEGPEGTVKDIEDAFASLPTQQQKVVELMKIKGYSAEEVSQETGMSVSAVKVSVHRALQKLKERL